MRHDFTDEPSFLEFSPDLGGYLDPIGHDEHDYPDTWLVSLESLLAELRYYPGIPVHTVTSPLQDEVIAHIDLARERSCSGKWLPF